MSGQPSEVMIFSPAVLRSHMDHRGLKIEDTAREIGVREKTVRRWLNEGTQPHHFAVSRMADVFGCDRQDFYIGSIEKAA